MAKLPFVVAPRIEPEIVQLGNETCGIIEIERRGYVTAGEKAFVNSQLAQDDITSRVVDLCRKICSSHKVDMQKAYETVNVLFSGKTSRGLASKVQQEYSDEISEIITSMVAGEERKRLIHAFCMILYRVEGDFTAQDLYDLDPQLVNALSDFYEKEESRSINKITDALVNEDEEVTPEIEDLQKK